jgi:hypothetical protein
MFLSRLRREFQEAYGDSRPIRRADLPHAHSFLNRFPAIAACLFVTLLLAGLASAFGLLRAQDAYFRWFGTANFCIFGIYVLGCSVRRFLRRNS